MARLLKNCGTNCPYCGSDENVEMTDWELNNNYLIYKMWCCDCSKSWREYSKVEYDGYTCDNKAYDKDGNLVK